MDSFIRFVAWEANTRNTIDFKTIYVDISEGDLIAGLLLSQIIYWFLPDRYGNLKTRIQKDGRYWICKERTEWYDEVRITEYQYDRAIKVLKRLNLVQVKLFKFNGTPMHHVSINADAITKALKKQYEELGAKMKDNVGMSIMLSDTDIVEPSSKPYLETLTGIKKEVLLLCQKEAKALKTPITIPEIKKDKDLKTFAFRIFFSIYDLKKAEAKTLERFDKVPWSTISVIFEHAKLYVENTDKQFRLLPQKYISEKRYNDEVILKDKEGNKIVQPQEEENFFSKNKKVYNG